MKNMTFYFANFLESNNPVSIESVDNYSSTHYDGTPRTNPGQSVANIPAGTWLRFTTTIPVGVFANCMLFASTLTPGQRVEVRAGSLNSSPLWSFTVSPVGVERFFTETSSGTIHYQATEAVDIYFSFPQGFTGYLNWFVFSQYSSSEPQEQKLRRMKWFNEARFGHMMHWGAYSVIARGEWVMHNENIPKDRYIQEGCIPFDPQDYDPEYWASLIESSGQKYLTVTTKHHDGFAMFDTNITGFAPYDVENTSDVHFSVLRPLAEACRARGIHFCCYYSWLDWGNDNEVAIENAKAIDPESINPDDVTRYLSQMKEHLREVIDIFDPELIWFDGSWAAFIDEDVSQAVKAFLRRLSPEIVINDRIGNNAGDFSTAEQSIPAGASTNPWEACMTMNNSWGYNSNDNNWKSSQTLLNNLIDCASKGGNYLLNTGPDGDGVIPQPSVDRLTTIGQWIDKWGEALYNTRAGTLDTSAQPGVWCTLSKDFKLYIIVTQIPDDKKVRIDQPLTLPQKAYWLHQEQTAVEWEISQGYMVFPLPDALSDPLGMVLVAEFDALPQPRPWIDLALFAHASADNVWNNDISEHGPQKVVDGDPQSRWATDRGDNVTLTLELVAPTTCERLTFHQYDQRIDQFTIEVFSGTQSVMTISGSNPPTLYTALLATPVTGDKIVLTIISCHDNKYPASLYYFSIFNTDIDLLPVNQPINLAKGGVAVASAIWNDDRVDYSAINVTDGDPHTRWASPDHTALPVTLTVEFLKTEIFDRIVVTEFLVAQETTRIKAFTLQALNDDGVSWRDIYQGSGLDKTIALPWLTSSRAIRFIITELVGTNGPSFYDVAVYQTARQLIPMSQEALLENEARLCFEFLWREANLTKGAKGFGLVADTSNSRRASIANSGFALSALVIAVERGWLSKELAELRCKLSLETLLYHAPQYKGFFQHFIDMDNLNGVDGNVSTVDTMLALNGVLTAGQYFGGECATLAQQIFDRVEWTSAIAPTGNFTMGWSPESGMMSATWAGYTEQFCMYPMAAGSTTFCPDDPAELFYRLERRRGHYGDCEDLVYAWDGDLFTYQFSHAWLDFRLLWDRKGTDWWQNSVDASINNRQFCIDTADVLPGLDANNWGITACNGPNGYYPYGAPPSGNAGEYNQHFTDGTVTPSGPLGSLPFMPQEVLTAMMAWYQDPRMWTSYGFVEAFNISNAAPWYCPFNSGLIKGLTLMMIENYRSGLIWNTYMSHPVIKTGLAKIFDVQMSEYWVQESDPSVTFTGNGWWLSEGRSFSTDGKSMATQSNGDSVEFTFNGRNVSYYGEPNTGQGEIDFYIDDVYHGTANANDTEHRDSDILYAVTGLSPEQHVLRAVKRSGNWMTLDAFKVYASNSFDAWTGSLSTSRVDLQLSQAADRTSATDTASYQLDQGASVTAATLSKDKRVITLSLIGLTPGHRYLLTTLGVSNEIKSETLNKRRFTLEV